MDRTLIIKRRAGWHIPQIMEKEYALFVRTWVFQGDKPDYDWVQDLTKKEASVMVKNGIASDFTFDDFKAESHFAAKENEKKRRRDAKKLKNPHG